jgi:hypothetical protein
MTMAKNGAKFRKSNRSHRLNNTCFPMQLKLGDQLTDASGEYEVIGRPYTTSAGKESTCASVVSIISTSR